MPWERPTLKQLYERISQDFSGRLLDGSPPLSRSVIAVFAKVWAGACNGMYAVLAYIFKQAFPTTATGQWLRLWAMAWGIYPKPATPAAGPARFIGSAGAIIPAGTLLQNPLNGLQYATRADLTLPEADAENAEVVVQAMENGLATNMSAGAGLYLVAPLAGVNPKAQVAGVGLTGGVDAEDDENLRARLLARLRKPPRGGSKSDFEEWAKEVPGVTRAWCYPLGLGIGTVSLTFVTDNAPSGPVPAPEMVQRVYDHIDPLRPAALKEWGVFAPETYHVDFTIKITPDSGAVRQAVLAELQDLFAREGHPGAVLLKSHLDEAISHAPGEFDHSLVVPAADVQVPEGYFPFIGVVDFVAMG